MAAKIRLSLPWPQLLCCGTNRAFTVVSHLLHSVPAQGVRMNCTTLALALPGTFQVPLRPWAGIMSEVQLACWHIWFGSARQRIPRCRCLTIATEWHQILQSLTPTSGYRGLFVSLPSRKNQLESEICLSPWCSYFIALWAIFKGFLEAGILWLCFLFWGVLCTVGCSVASLLPTRCHISINHL